MKLSVIIPCFNEINTIEQIISKVQNFNDLEKEIIVIDDCSNDGTKEKLNSEISNSIDKLITNDKNFGKGYSLRKGISVATGDIIIFQDADDLVNAHWPTPPDA